MEIELPAKSTVWSAFVAGDPVRPSQREGKLLLPLERSFASDTPIGVDLTFVGQAQNPNLFLNYDTDVAGQQWDKLEKAQQVAAAKVSPLRVNLPTRGLRFSFAQVLQTEIRKPMTIRLLAENTKVPSWGTRLAVALLGFAVFWLLMAGLNRRLESKRNHQAKCGVATATDSAPKNHAGLPGRAS